MLDERVIWVTGKGGVGKTTVAAALGLASARAGRRTIVCEVGGQDRLGRLFGRELRSGVETPLEGGLSGIAIDPQEALIEWLAKQLASRALMRVLVNSSAFQYFVAAAPGAREMVSVAKVWELAQAERWDRSAARYDQVIVDAPASGHGLAMLRTPRTFSEIARVGPIRRQADKVSALFADPARSRYVVVALPEEMPIVETLELESALQDSLGRRLDAVVVNAVLPRRFSAGEAERLAAAAQHDSRGPAVEEALRAASAEHAWVRRQQSQIGRLRRATGAKVVTLPYVFEPAVELEQLRWLAVELQRRLG